jgi:hypothetical protein
VVASLGKPPSVSILQQIRNLFRAITFERKMPSIAPTIRCLVDRGIHGFDFDFGGAQRTFRRHRRKLFLVARAHSDRSPASAVAEVVLQRQDFTALPGIFMVVAFLAINQGAYGIAIWLKNRGPPQGRDLPSRFRNRI